MIFHEYLRTVVREFKQREQNTKFLEGFLAIFRRNFRIIWQYKFSIIMGFVTNLIIFSLFFYVALLVPEMQISQDNYIVDSVSFIFAGVILVEISTRTLSRSLNSFTSEMKQGTFETLVTLPFGLKRYFISEIAFEMFYGVFISIIYFIPILFIYPAFKSVSISIESIFALLLVSFCCILIFFSLSLIAANFTILVKRGREISMVIIGIISLLSGSLFPLSMFPKWLQIIAQFSPITLAVRAFRLCMFGNGTITDSIVWISIIVLISSAVFFYIIFHFSYKRIYNRIRQTGTTHEF
ncbi:MAG: ABC transporter permease [Candidatus Heimdallarchaeota archaeon]|nr:ABC transporter permease [Candidatus Heimdallarchaeota archaeon]MCK4955192.1 ABC transporter permease [Candidatus Heimdallarchaeota archaeon]